MKIYAAIYARRSDPKEVSVTVTNQIEDAKAFAASKGWTVRDQDIFTDEGVSGANVKRLRGRQRLLDTIHDGAPFGVLVVRDESRFTRRPGLRAMLEMIDVAEAGVDLWWYQTGQKFEHGSMEQELGTLVKTYGNNKVVRDTSAWLTTALVKKAKAGFVTGGRTYGYTNVRNGKNTERVINTEQADVIVWIFERCAAGDSHRQIAHALNAKGVKGNTRGGWADYNIQQLLKRDIYRGELVYNKTKQKNDDGADCKQRRPESEWIRTSVPQLQIVSDDLWKKAQDRMAAKIVDGNMHQPKRLTGRGQRTRQQYFLSGFAKCSVCGASMIAVQRLKGQQRVHWLVCSVNHKQGPSKCANGLRFDMKTLDAFFAKRLADDVLDPDVYRDALTRALAIHAKASDDDTTDQLQKDLDRLDANLKQLALAVERSGADAVVDLLTKRTEERRALAAQLKRQLAAPSRKLTPARCKAEADARMAEFRDGLTLSDTFAARTILDTFLEDRIVCTPDQKACSYRLDWTVDFGQVFSAILPGLSLMPFSTTGAQHKLLRKYSAKVQALKGASWRKSPRRAAA